MLRGNETSEKAPKQRKLGRRETCKCPLQFFPTSLSPPARPTPHQQTLAAKHGSRRQQHPDPRQVLSNDRALSSDGYGERHQGQLVFRFFGFPDRELETTEGQTSFEGGGTGAVGAGFCSGAERRLRVLSGAGLPGPGWYLLCPLSPSLVSFFFNCRPIPRVASLPLFFCSFARLSCLPTDLLVSCSHYLLFLFLFFV